MKNWKLVYSSEFVDDLTAIVEYIKKDSPHAADI